MIKYIYWLIFRKKTPQGGLVKDIPTCHTYTGSGLNKDCGITTASANKAISKAFNKDYGTTWNKNSITVTKFKEDKQND